MSIELDRVREYRRAARFAVESPASVQARCLALIDLSEEARAEEDPFIRLWSERAVWAESKAFLGADDEESEVAPEAFERAQRRLRDRGFSSCPECLSVLATDADFERWREMRLAHIAEVERREKAVGP